MGIEADVVLVDVGKQLVRSKNLRNLDELVIVVMAVEEGLFAEDLAVRKQFNGAHEESNILRTMDANMQPKLHISKL